eukprot:TRINITY_DN78240_c0_g1_i1.p1 TRINITY_DN78240_c0_g1~~TRINITY_DN78240_c0_g1_i1.p1  ORF type:complete len:397 (+),score=51.21 TRINITY_DN78240_c0_g1_i1:145-1335(+)
MNDAGPSDVARAEDEDMAPIARDFCAFLVRASDLQSELDLFLDRNCSEFKGGSLSGEQKLTWTTLHKDYVTLVEQRLDMFLRDRGATAEELCRSLEVILGGSVWSMPLLRSLEYEQFAAQMIARAELPMLKAEAEASSAGTLGGVWKCLPDKTDSRSFDKFLKAQGMPWVLRRLHIFAAASELSIVEMPGTFPIYTLLVSRSHGFGVSMEQVVADGKERCDGSSRVKAWLEGCDLYVVLHSPCRNVPVASLAGTSFNEAVAVESHYSLAGPDGHLRCINRLLFAAGSADSEVSYTQCYVRVTSRSEEAMVPITGKTTLGNPSLEGGAEDSQAVACSINCEKQSSHAQGSPPLQSSESPYPNSSQPVAPVIPTAPPGSPQRPAPNVRRLRPAPARAG